MPISKQTDIKNLHYLNDTTVFSPKFDAAGLIPAVVTDYNNMQVLMFAYMNKESLELTIKTKIACFYSRSRDTLWTKGETSGNILEIKEIAVDCDQDCVLLKVIVLGDGVVCHTKKKSCFYRTLKNGALVFS